MIYAAALPIEEYVVNIEGTEYGLYTMYKDRPEILALIAICTPLLYDYEGCRPPLQRRIDLGSLDVYHETLKFCIDGKTVADLLAEKNPLEFYDFIQDKSLSEIPLVKKYLKGEVDPFKLIVGARAAAWGLAYRGQVSKNEKIIKVSFRGLDVPRYLRELHQNLKRALMHHDSK